MQHFRGPGSLQAAINSYKLLVANGAESANIIRQRTSAGHEFILFCNYRDYYNYRMTTGPRELHRVVLGKRNLHIDLEAPMSLPLADFNSDVHQICQLVHGYVYRFMTDICGQPWQWSDYDKLVIARSARCPHFPEQTRRSVHLNFPQVRFKCNLGEYRFMHELLARVRALKLSVEPDMNLYRSKPDTTHSLRLAGTEKLTERETSFLQYETYIQQPYLHDPVWFDPSDTTVEWTYVTFDAFQLPRVASEARATGMPERPSRMPRPVIDQAVSEYLHVLWPRLECSIYPSQAPYVAATVRPDWMATIVHPVPGVKWFALAMMEQTRAGAGFDRFWELLQRVKPTEDGVDREKRKRKYRERYLSAQREFADHPRFLVENRTLAKFVRGGLDALPRFCPFGVEGCAMDFAVYYIERSKRYFIHCRSCGNKRQVGTRDTFRDMGYFCSPYIDQFMPPGLFSVPGRATFVINSGMGTGKTTWLRQELLAANPVKVLMVSVRVVLAECYHHWIECDMYTAIKDFRAYYEDHPARAWIAIQLESLKRFARSFDVLPSIDVLVLDEYWSLMLQFQSSTMERRMRECCNALFALMRLAQKVVILDADARPYGEPWEAVKRERGEDVALLYNLHLPDPVKHYTIMDYDALLERIYFRVRFSHLVGICSGSRLELESIQRSIADRLAQETDGEQEFVPLTYSSQSSDEHMLTVSRADELWQGMHVCYTPTITVGANYKPTENEEQEREREVFIIASELTASPTTMLQMAGRFRWSRRVCIAMLPTMFVTKTDAFSGTIDDVLVCCQENIARYRNTLAEHAPRVINSMGAWVVDPLDHATRMAAWCKAERLLARADYLGMLRLLILQHGERFVDERQLPPWMNTRPAVLQRVVSNCQLEQFEQTALRLSEDATARATLLLKYDVMPHQCNLTGRELAFLEHSERAVCYLQCLSLHGGLLGPLQNLDELYTAELIAGGAAVEDAAQLYRHPLTRYLQSTTAQNKLMPLRETHALTIAWASRALSPFIQWCAVGQFATSKQIVEEIYDVEQFHADYMKPLSEPKNQDLFRMFGFSSSQLNKVPAKINSMLSILRKFAAIFELQITTRKRLSHRAPSTFCMDFQRANDILQIARGQTCGHELEPLAIINARATSV